MKYKPQNKEKMNQVGKIMTSNYENRGKWILSFLYVEGKSGDFRESVYGRTRLMKELFLVDNRIRKKGSETEMEFEPDKFGPSDTKLLIALQDLKENGLVRVIPKAKISELTLTGDGIVKAREILQGMNPVKIGSLRKIKREFNFKKQKDLLKHIYEEYPEYTTKSQIKPWVLGKNQLLTAKEREIESDKSTLLVEIEDIIDLKRPEQTFAESPHIYSILNLEPVDISKPLNLSDFNGDLDESDRAEIESGYIYHDILYDKPQSLVVRILERFLNASDELEVSLRPREHKNLVHRLVHN